MKKIIVASVFGIAVMLTAGSVFAAEKAPQKVIDLANTELVKLGSDPAIVQAVKAENAKGKTLAQIKEKDVKWMATPGVVDYMKALMDNPCGKRLKEIRKSAPYYAELFVMDNLGANVCMSDKTSDYWQGDEPKFTESYKGGKGAVHVGDVKFDDSTQAYTVQVSVPVKDGAAVIGAMTIGIDMDKLK
ncbi:PDC sensor domain-containing protein [Thiovibrio frasassiensis]|uniref:PDC sensor domain-containing protein n=1 Tax=Thiovibrio frasassiensis TaxID=2984131 RepID=A0A9X4ME07_9BACT|nr:PDC sensor domain-containing protein [Thiovibrio frasassiensis]MDG4474566.1 PDC sensor domain-containing protein [Thiovibrio frasassiensis]